MFAQVEKPKENKSRAVANSVVQERSNSKQGFEFVDNRPESIIQRKLLNEGVRNTSLSQLKANISQLNDYPNTMSEKFGSEVNEANTAALDKDYEAGPGPYVQGTKGFHSFIKSGKMFKWIYGEKNGLVIIDPTLKHAVAAGGGGVITAGQGQLSGKFHIWINNDTGHYKTSFESLDSSISAWLAVGYTVETRKRIDFSGVLGNLGGGRKKFLGIF